MKKLNFIEVGRLKRFVKRHLKDNSDLFDTGSEIDRSLSYDENEALLTEKIALFKPASELSKTDALNLKLLAEEEKAAKEKELLASWKETINTGSAIIPEFGIAKDLILTTVKGESNATILTGEGGIGKTYLTLQTIKESGAEFIYRNGYTTPLSFYKTLYDNNGKLIVMDDVEGLFTDPKGIALLKGALWDTAGKRLLNYVSTSDKLDNLPPIFEFTGKMVILANTIPHKNYANVNAMISRAIHYRVEFSHAQKMAIIKEVLDKKTALSQEQKAKAWNLIQAHTSIATKNFNIRTLEKLCYFIKYDESKAESLFKATIEEDGEERLVYELMQNNNLSVIEQVARFIEETGKSRRTYFTMKKKLLERIKSAKVQPKQDMPPALQGEPSQGSEESTNTIVKQPG